MKECLIDLCVKIYEDRFIFVVGWIFLLLFGEERKEKKIHNHILPLSSILF